MKAMATIVTITPNPLLDFLAEEELRPGRVTRSAGFTASVGGKAINMARVLARHGHRCSALGFAGGATGAMLMALVAADGVEPAFTDTTARLRVGFIARTAPGQPNTALLETGFAVSEDEQMALLTELDRRLATGADLVLVGGSVPCVPCNGLIAAIASRAAAAGVACWIDSYGPAMDAALAGPHPPALAKPNREELDGSPAAWERAGELHISDGPAPLEVRRGRERWRVIPPTVTELNQTGSGDSYVAALAHARLSGLPFPDQLRYAAAAGAANAARWDIAGIGPAHIAPLVGAAVVEQLP
jgi:fructose-1-phosphate kinase PfkB-like protein